MSYLPRIGLVATCGLVVAFLSWSGLVKQTGGIAFADVQKELQKMRTVRYVSTRLADAAADDPEELRELERKGGKGDPNRVFRTAGNMHQPRLIKIMGRYLQRTETLNGLGVVETIEINDYKQGKHVTLQPKTKEFTELSGQIVMDRDGKTTSDQPTKPAPEADLFTNISQIPAEATTRLPERTLGGKKVIGFFSQKTTPTQQGTVTWERTYWVDPETKRPVRIEVSFYGTDKFVGRSDWIESEFVFDQPMSEDEFKTEAPEGFKVEKTKVMGIKID